DHGRDYLTRVLYGGRVSLLVGVFALMIAVVVGTLAGTVSGYFGGFIDNMGMRFLDIFMSIPSFFLLMILNAYLKRGISNIIIIIGLLSWMEVARRVRAETLTLK
ncbi:ABC transporter permease subunit, partial [Listeria monocytogenes]|nr:ABC transporter permease subunit [Listeria monocytogenes]